jgi:hypothetical protein
VPVVFCFDQIEALQVNGNDEASLFAFGRIVMELFHETQNVLILSCVQIGFLETMKAAMFKPAWDRLAMVRRSIDPLRWDDATALIAARMDAVPELKALRASKPDQPLWPLDAARLRVRIGSQETARRILAECADQFDGLQNHRAVETDSGSRLEQAWREQLGGARRSNAPEQTAEILGHGLPTLVQLIAPEWSLVRDHGLRDVDLLWKGPDGRLGIHLSVSRDNRGVWRPFERLRGLLRDGAIEKLVVVRDPRLPLSAPGTQKLHAELIEAGARALRPSAELLAALDALRRILSDAKAGDLSAEGRTLALSTVEQWLKDNLPDDLRGLADELLAYPGVGGGDRGPTDHFDDLATQHLALRDDCPILPIDSASTVLGVDSRSLEACVRTRADAFGLIPGPPDILFRLATRPTVAARPAPVSA